jgi:nicotinate-nucleotide--dimethylbenzimidazole phosphoribosyltransferase
MLRAFLSGGAAANVLAAMSDVALRVVDLSVDDDLVDIPESVTRFKVMRGSGNIAVENAMTEEQSEKAFTQGMAIADEEIDSGADLLITGDMGIGNTTPAAVLIAALTGSDAATVTGRGTGIDDNAWMRKCASIRDALRRARPILGDQIALLAAVGGADIAAMSGFIAQSARRRTPVLLDGVVSGAAALVAHRIAYRAAHWWAAGHLSVEPAHATALTRLSLEPIVDFGMRLGEGTGALVALPVLQAAAGTLAGMATLADLGIASTDG